ncbi:hypothetical protein LCGC14_2917100, partial [marine sediment metagenome]
MGQIFIEGLGNIRIEGDAPNESETQVILNAISKIKSPPFRQKFEGQEQAAPQRVEEGPLGRPPQPTKPPAPVEGPLGIVGAETRQDVRKTIEDA